MSSQMTPNTSSPRETPRVTPAEAINHISSSALIDASPKEVWDMLLDTSTWPTWNSFCPRVTIREQPASSTTCPDMPQSHILQRGTKMTFHVHMDPTSSAVTDTHLIVVRCDAPDVTNGRPGRIIWATDPSAKGSFPLFLLLAERVHEIAEVEVGDAGADAAGDGKKRYTEVRTWESQKGPLAYLVRWMYEAVLKDAFRRWVLDLKRRIDEEKHGSEV